MRVAELSDAALTPLMDLAEIMRLCRGVDRTHRLDGEAVARTLEAIRRFATRARELGVGVVAAVGSSADRERSSPHRRGSHISGQGRARAASAALRQISH